MSGDRKTHRFDAHRTADDQGARSDGRRLLGASVTATLLWLSGCGGAPAELAEPVTVADHGASNPTVAVDRERGTYYIAWVGTNDGVSDVYVARSDDGVGFDGPVRVNHIAGDASPHEQAPAQIATGAHGEVYVVWQNNTHVEGRRFPYSDLRFARSTDGGRTFAPAITVNDDADGPPSSHTFHDIAVSDDGVVHVSWIDSRVRTAAERAAGSAEVRPVHAPDRAAHGASDLPGPEIRVAHSKNGRSFGASEVVAQDACPCCRTSLAAGPDGDLALAWRDVDERSIRDIVVARGSVDQGFDAPVGVREDFWSIEGCPHAGPGLALDGEGRTHVAWYTGSPDGEGLYYAVAETGETSFGAPQALLSGGWVPVSQVKVAAAGQGVVLAWDDRRRDVPTVQVAVAGEGGEPRIIAEGMPGASPAVAAAGPYAAVAWLDGETVRFAPVRFATVQP